MDAATDRLKRHYQSQLDLTLALGHASLGCCEKAAEINTTTARKLFAQVDADPETLIRGDVAKMAVASGKIALAHWASSIACGLELQRQLIASLARE